MKQKPLFDRILVKQLPAEEKIGGIIIPNTSNNLKYGTVIAAGAGKPGSPMTVKEGQTILFKRDDVITPVTLKGEEYFLMFERDVYMGD